ncbi:MAG TPA: hypothetical protein VER03_13485 [Bryobacteraceae bacterium]|nr:hypothetical protein [Bryobacteraceae bacterium]
MAQFLKDGSDSRPEAVITEPRSPSQVLTGSQSQIEWAERIRQTASDEFDRVARSFRTVAAAQEGPKRVRTESILAILEDQRQAVMSRTDAGYFIRDWQDISDQVRQMLGRDPRLHALKADIGRGEPK